MLRVSVEEVVLPIRTTCGLLVRKSRIHKLHKERLMCRSLSFMISLEGTMQLKAEL